MLGAGVRHYKKRSSGSDPVERPSWSRSRWGRYSRTSPTATTARRTHWQKSSTTPVGDVQTQVFQVTHPFHPLAGQRFELVDRYRTWGEDRVYYHTATGELKSLPAGWTDVDEPDPFVVIGAGRASFRPADLWAVVQLIQGLER